MQKNYKNQRLKPALTYLYELLIWMYVQLWHTTQHSKSSLLSTRQ